MKRLVAIAIALASAAPAPAQSTFHGNVARTGVYASEAPRKLTGVKWTFKAAGPIVASPAVTGGVVYIASLDGHMYALDEETGRERWRFKSRMPIASSPAVEEGTLYFVSSTGAIGALDAADGEPKWVFATEHEKRFEAKGLHGYPSPAQTIPDAWDVFTSSPAVSGGKVFFGSGDGGVYAVDAKTGLLQWKFSTEGVVHGSPAVSGGTVYVGSWDSRLYALDAESGQEKWSFQAGVDPIAHNQVGFQSSPAVVDGTVYIGCRDAHVYAIDATSGKKKWDYPTGKSWVNATPAIKDGLVFTATSDSSRFMALDAKSGRLRFNFDAKAFVFSSPALAGGLAIFGSHNGRLYAVDAGNGELAWQFQTEASKADPLKVLTPEGEFSPDAFSPVFGDFQDMYLAFYRFVTIGGIMSSPAVDGGVVFFGSLDGNVYALH